MVIATLQMSVPPEKRPVPDKPKRLKLWHKMTLGCTGVLLAYVLLSLGIFYLIARKSGTERRSGGDLINAPRPQVADEENAFETLQRAAAQLHWSEEDAWSIRFMIYPRLYT